MHLHMPQDLKSYAAYRLTTGYPRAKCLLPGWRCDDLKYWQYKEKVIDKEMRTVCCAIW